MIVIKLTIVFISLMIFISCATIINRKTTRVNIYCDVDSAIVCIKDTNHCYPMPLSIDLMRSEEGVVLYVSEDSLKNIYLLESSLSTAFWLGNMFSGAGLLGYLIDSFSPKRFTYPEHNFVSLLGEKNILGESETDEFEIETPQMWIPSVQNQLNLKFSVPYFNHFYINKHKDFGSSFGFFGLSAGLEYFLKNGFSLNSDIGGMVTFPLPFPAPVDYSGDHNSSGALFCDFQIGKDINRFHTDLGLQFNTNLYQEMETIELFPNYIDTLKYSRRQYSVGLALSGYHYCPVKDTRQLHKYNKK